MSKISTSKKFNRPVHNWLQNISLAYFPIKTTPLLDTFAERMLHCFTDMGHQILPDPRQGPDVLLTTAIFGEPVNWRDALLFTARRRFKLDHAPLVFTLMHVEPDKLQELLDYFSRVLDKDQPDPADYTFPGLAPLAYHTLYEQGRRGGPMLALVRLLQSQAMSIRVILVVGSDSPIEAYTFDLVGAHPRSDAGEGENFYIDLALRILTAASTQEVTEHAVLEEPLPQEVWQSLSTPAEMLRAGRELGQRKFFTEMVRVANLVNVPALHDAVSSQYSEGCFATWEPELGALLSTITGSARPVEKDNLSNDELALITGVRPDGLGAVVRNVEGKRNDAPSSEAVELFKMDEPLPRLVLGSDWGFSSEVQVPVVRSKLHGHRGVRAFDPRFVEHARLEEAYYHFPVSCSTEAQARSIHAAFGAAAALQNPSDPRQVIFTVMPGHGIVIVEKWVQGKAPFQLIWEYMDAGLIEIDNFIPQGPLTYQSAPDGRMVLQA